MRLDARIQFADSTHEDLTKNLLKNESFVKLERLTNEEVHNFTKGTRRFKLVRDEMKRIRREAREKSRKKNTKTLHYDGRKKAEEFAKFIECDNGEMYSISDHFAIIQPRFKAVVDIDRDCSFSETSSVTGTSGSTNRSRPRRLSMVPQRFTITNESPKLKQPAKKLKLDPEASYEVEAIRNMNLINNEIVVQVKWENYPEKVNTWEPLENVRDCEAFEDFLKYELDGQEKAIDAVLTQLTEEMKEELEAFGKKPKTAIMQELKKLDFLEFQCYQIIYMLITDQPNHYQSFRKTFRHMVLLDHFHKLDNTQYKAHKEITADILNHEPHISVSISNDVDFSVLEYFNYVRENVFPSEVSNPEKGSIGCKCVGGCSRESKCCPSTVKGAKFVYKNINGKNRLRQTRFTQMIYECNEHCTCDENCVNRVTQQPRLIPLKIFKTSNGRGWGLKTRVNIPKGTFIMEYTGEIIDQEESVRRGKVYDQIGQSYLFDLDYNEKSEAVFTIDAFKSGNLSRLINHSCDPNCKIWPVTTCNQNPLIYKICYFSTKFIKTGEELTFDYGGGNDDDEDISDNESEAAEAGITGTITQRHRTTDLCKCGSEKCRGFIFSF